MAQAVICPSCGAKVSAERGRCPRCRGVLTAPDPAAAAAASRRLGTAALICVAVFATGLAALWVVRDPAPAVLSNTPPGDPLASRRPPARAATPPASALVPAEPPATRPFMDPSATGQVAYGSGDFAAALAAFQAAVEGNPDDAESWSNLGQLLVRLDRVPEAIPCFDRAIAIIPARWAYTFNKARALGLLGRWDEAIVGYRRAQQLYPDDSVTTFNLALALHKKGDGPAAVLEYQKAIALAPEDASFRLALGISLERLGRAADAATAYGEYLRLAPSAADGDQIRARIGRLGRPQSSPTAGS